MFISYITLCKTCDPIGDQRGIILTNLVEDHKVMIHTKYQSSKPYGFREDFLSVCLENLFLAPVT
jgi:hypothetical protein